MARVNDDNWLDKALDGALHSNDTRPDFEAWKANHPGAVETLTSQKMPVMKTIWINAWYVKLAAAALIAIAAIIGISQLTQPKPTPPQMKFSNGAALLIGPATHTFGDGSVVKLDNGAQIRTYDEVTQRGFEHLTGTIDVTVAKGLGEFIVTTPYGEVKALGTEFTLDLVDGTADTGQKVELLSVEVTEGKVEVSNDKGKMTLAASQDTIVEKNAAPYDFNQDEALPERLKERMQAMLDAFATGDAAAWGANFNLGYMFKLIKGQVEYDPLRFGGSKEDAERLQEMLKDIGSPEQLAQAFVGNVNITESMKIYVRSVTLSADGQHAQAECIRRKSARSMTLTTPQWHYFDDDWWQIDD